MLWVLWTPRILQCLLPTVAVSAVSAVQGAAVGRCSADGLHQQGLECGAKQWLPNRTATSSVTYTLDFLRTSPYKRPVFSIIDVLLVHLVIHLISELLEVEMHWTKIINHIPALSPYLLLSSSPSIANTSQCFNLFGTLLERRPWHRKTSSLWLVLPKRLLRAARKASGSN